MGRKVIPSNDPDRLSRVMNERTRTIGVDMQGLEAQKQMKQAQKEQVELEERTHAMQTRAMTAALDAAIFSAEEHRRYQLRVLSEELQRQSEIKKAYDEALREALTNEVRPEYFEQFGTSHR